MITHFNTNDFTFHDCFWWNGTTPYGCEVNLPHCHAIAQIKHSTVKLCPLLSEGDSFHALWKTFLQPLMYFRLPKVFIKINLHAFYVFLRLSHSFFTGVLHCKWILTFMILIFVAILSVSVTTARLYSTWHLQMDVIHVYIL